MRIYLSIPTDLPDIAPIEIEIEADNLTQIDELIRRVQMIRDAANV